MADLVTIEEAKAHLRVDSTADDTWIAVFIPAISQAVFTWLKDDWRAYEWVKDSAGEFLRDSNDEPYILEDSNGPVIKPVAAAACLVELAQQYRFRDGSGAAAVPSHAGHGYVLGAGATSLLNGLRKTTLK